MIPYLVLLLSWLLPLVAGMGIWQAMNGRANGLTGWAAAIGYGYVIGVFLVGEMGAVFDGRNARTVVLDLTPWLLLIGAATWIAAWLRRRGATAPAIAPPTHDAMRTSVWCVLAGLLLLRTWVLMDEVLLRPIFPWDAWSAWAIKPKTWFALGHAVPFVSAGEWLANPLAELRTAAVWNYPDLLGWIEVWFASGAGEWNEPLINLAWVGVWLALLVGSYGQWRSLGLSATRACIAMYILGSLPLINAHVALAGYADLWLAAVFGLAVLCWLNWLHSRRLGQLLTAVGLGLCLPAIKLEGAVWLLCFAVVLVLGFVPPRLRLPLLAGTFALLILGIVLGGFVLPVYGLGLVKVAWGQIDVPTLGAMALRWRTVGHAMLASLYTLPNWHLLWFIFPCVLLLRWRAFRERESLRLLGGLLLLCASFLFVLFFFTEAARWAENYTSANRLIMHITPVVVTLLALLLQGFDVVPKSSGTAPGSAQ